MQIKHQKDFWSGLLFIVVGVGFAIGALSYNFGSSARPGPGYFPFGLGALLAVLGAVIMFTSLQGEHKPADEIGPWAYRPLLWISLSVAIFGWALPHLGMVIALPVLVVVSAMAGDEFHWGEALVNSAILTVGSWLIFVVGLNLTIPMWPAFLAK